MRTEPRFRNHLLWLAPILALFGFLSYFLIFIRWPLLREVPFVNFAILLVAAIAAVLAARRARGRARWQRWTSLALLPLPFLLAGMLALFCVRGSALPPPPSAGLVAGAAVPDLRVLDHHGGEVSMAELSQGRVVVVFFRGAWCLFCRTQLSELQARLEEFKQAGVEVVAVSNESVDENRALAERLGLGFRLLSDPALEVIDRFGVRHQREGRELPISLPATFLLADGRVLWRHVSENYRLRPGPSDLLQQLALLDAGDEQADSRPGSRLSRACASYDASRRERVACSGRGGSGVAAAAGFARGARR